LIPSHVKTPRGTAQLSAAPTACNGYGELALPTSLTRDRSAMQCESVAPRASRLGAFIKGIDYGACGSCFIDGSFPTVCLSPERCRGSGSPLVGPLCRSVCVNYRSEFGKRKSSHGPAPSWVKWTPASTFRDPGKRGVGGTKSVDYGACGSCI